MKGNKEDIEKLIKILRKIKIFFWIDTPQGREYWDEVHDNLKEILENLNKKFCSKCGQEIKDE